MLMVSCGIQMVIAFQLFVAHQEEVARLQVVCEIPFSLQMSAVMIFVTMMFNHVSEMWRGAQIILASTHHIGGNGGKIGDLEPLSDSEEEEGSQSQQELRSPIVAGSGKRLLIFVVGVVTEIATWGAILMSGVLWIVTSVDVDLVIRSTVAVMLRVERGRDHLPVLLPRHHHGGCGGDQVSGAQRPVDAQDAVECASQEVARGRALLLHLRLSPHAAGLGRGARVRPARLVILRALHRILSGLVCPFVCARARG